MTIYMEKFYTPPAIAQHCVEIVQQTWGSKITSYLEPSAGGGVFLNYLPPETLSFDIAPEDPRIQTQDFLTCSLPYQKGRCVIGNPPFRCSGTGNMFKRFLNQASLIGDYIAFILPVGLYQNDVAFYRYPLIHSELIHFPLEHRTLTCCYNLYQRPEVPRIKPDFRLQQVVLKSSERPKHLLEGGDFRINVFGNIGHEAARPNQFCRELVFFIEPEWRQRVIDLMRKTDYKKVFSVHNSHQTLSSWKVYRYLRENLKGIC